MWLATPDFDLGRAGCDINLIGTRDVKAGEYAESIDHYGSLYYLVVRCEGAWATDFTVKQRFAIVVEIARNAEIAPYQRDLPAATKGLTTATGGDGMTDLLGTCEVGIEIIEKACWKCKRRLYSVSGVVTTDPDCRRWTKAEWNGDGWRVRDFYALYQFSDHAAKQLAAAIDALSASAQDWLSRNNAVFAKIERRFIKAADLTLWTSVCSRCKSTDGPSKLIEEERPPLVRNWVQNVQQKKMIYRGTTLTFASPQRTYAAVKAEHQISHFLEGR